MCSEPENRDSIDLNANLIRVARIFFLVVMLATVLNGSMFWLRKVGWVDPHIYQYYVQEYCLNRPLTRSFQEVFEIRRFIAQTYQSEGLWIAAKLAKDFIILCFLGFSLYLWRPLGKNSVPASKLLWLFAVFVLISACYSGSRFGFLLPMAGLRAFSFLWIALAGFWASRTASLELLSRFLVFLIAFQLILLPVELGRGLHFFGLRIVGTFLQPSSLGIASVLMLAFWIGFSEVDLTGLLIMAGCTTILVYFSGSATALLLLLLLAAIYPLVFSKNTKLRYILSICLVLLPVIAAFLPEITGRHDVFDSLYGRIVLLRDYVAVNLSVSELFFGKGLGAGTNAAANLLMNWRAGMPPGLGEEVVFIADSWLLTLISQTGLAGVALFYSLMFIAIVKDRHARLYYVLTATASLTTSIVELFPNSLILGLLLSRTFSQIHPSVGLHKPVKDVEKMMPFA